jgi:hypothetical protein
MLYGWADLPKPLPHPHTVFSLTFGLVATNPLPTRRHGPVLCRCIAGQFSHLFLMALQHAKKAFFNAVVSPARINVMTGATVRLPPPAAPAMPTLAAPLPLAMLATVFRPDFRIL